MILPALKRGKYTAESQFHLGTRLGGGKHIVDVVARNNANEAFLISLKWQQTSGTAEQKVPFEVICLIDALETNSPAYKSAYLVLGGSGWKLRDFYTKGGLDRFLHYKDLVKILTLEDFVAKANYGKL